MILTFHINYDAPLINGMLIGPVAQKAADTTDTLLTYMHAIK